MSLTETLDAIRAGAEKKIPAPMLALMHKATQELSDSGAASNILAVGSKLPNFELNNQYGNSISSASLLNHGPLLLSFYRGLW